MQINTLSMSIYRTDRANLDIKLSMSTNEGGIH